MCLRGAGGEDPADPGPVGEQRAEPGRAPGPGPARRWGRGQLRGVLLRPLTTSQPPPKKRQTKTERA